MNSALALLSHDMPDLFYQVTHYASSPGGMLFFCVLIIWIGNRERGRLSLLIFSLSVSLNELLKVLFHIPRPWLSHPEAAPIIAGGGYAFPCLHTQITAAVLGSYALSSARKSTRFLCAAGILITAAVQLVSGAQSVLDVICGLFFGVACAAIGHRVVSAPHQKKGWITLMGIACVLGLLAGVVTDEGWGFGSVCSVIILYWLDPVLKKTDINWQGFWKALSVIIAAGCFIGLLIFLPFLVEWLLTPYWPGQSLIVFLLTVVPCLVRFFL